KRDPGTNGRARDAAGLDLRALARTGPVHFVGISGAGVSALAELVLRSGGRVTGCDLRSGPVVDALRALGADVAHADDFHARVLDRCLFEFEDHHVTLL